MNILENLNGRIKILDGEPSYGGEDAVKQVVETSPIQLPNDYIEFLKSISGQTSDGEENFGPEFGVEVGDYTLSLWIFSAQLALEKYREYKIDSAPIYDDIIPASNEPSAVLARAFGECREGQIPRSSAALQV